MGKLVNSLCLLLLFGFLTTEISWAAKEDAKGKDSALPPEFYCEASIFYSWKRVPRVDPHASASAAASAPAASPEDEKPSEVFFTRIGESGSAEVDAKNRLSSRLSAAEGEALKSCRTEHESESSCVSEQLVRVQKEYQLLDFAARHALLSTITEDCRTSKGLCLSTRSSQIACAQVQTSGQATDGAGTGKKGETGKKK